MEKKGEKTREGSGTGIELEIPRGRRTHRWGSTASLGLLVGFALLIYFSFDGRAFRFLAAIQEWPGLSRFWGRPALVASLSLFWVFLGAAGVLEWKRHRERLESIPIRIHVNGSRGKTGTCRLIDAALRANGLRVVTKTTGKVPVLIDVRGNERFLERRRGRTGNLREQNAIVGIAAAQKADALVIECMAVEPELQRVSEEKLIRATIAVITNVRRDHLEVMGPDVESVAKNLCGMIPRRGIVVTPEDRFLPLIRREAVKRGARVVSVNPEALPYSLVDAFPHVTFRESVATALEIGRLLRLDPEKSLHGMLQSTPDFGAVQLLRRRGSKGPYLLVGAFGVNDVDSFTSLHQELLRRGELNGGPMVGLFNSREDRALRSVQFARAMARELSFESIVVMGSYTGAFARSALRAGYPRERLLLAEGATPGEILGVLDDIVPENGVVLACGNMVTEAGYRFMELLRGDSSYGRLGR